MLSFEEILDDFPCFLVDFYQSHYVMKKTFQKQPVYLRFTCLFCTEQFRKDYKLKLHLMMKHKDQPAHLMEQAKEELIKVKFTIELILLHFGKN